MTVSLTMYWLPQCSTCRDAVKSLQNKGHEVSTIHIKDDPPKADEMKTLVENSGLNIRRFFNTSGIAYREMKLKDKIDGMSEQEKLDLLASNGMLIKRPIVTDGTKVTVGYKEEEYERVWGS